MNSERVETTGPELDALEVYDYLGRKVEADSKAAMFVSRWEAGRIVAALRYKAELYDEVWELVTSKGYMNVTTAIAKLEQERDALAAMVAEKDPFGAKLTSITEKLDRCMQLAAQAKPAPHVLEVVIALREAVDYLGINFNNTICSGSKLHRRLSEALAAAPEAGS
ncbi:hypothetical protein D3C81_318020 [compost metagenome]